jgi:hypothetical protein
LGEKFGGAEREESAGVLETADGGFLIAGDSFSDTNDVKTVPRFNERGPADYWILRLNSAGDILWQKAYGGVHHDALYAVARTSTGGFVLVGASSSPPSGNKESPVSGDGGDCWIVCVDENGGKVWERSFDGGGYDEGLEISPTRDGNFIIGVQSNLASGAVRFWLLKLSPEGEVLWGKSLDGGGGQSLYGLQQTVDGGYILLLGGPSGSVGWYRPSLIRFDADGNRVWDATYGELDEVLLDLQLTADGGSIMAGRTFLRGRPGLPPAFYIVKLAPDALTAPTLRLHNQRLTLDGITGRIYIAEASADFLAWAPFATNTLATNSIEIPDPSPAPDRRFYRAFMRP